MAFLNRNITRAAIVLCMLAGTPAWGQDLTLAEQKIKAGMLYNFLKYTDWPAGAPSSSATICLLGGDPFAGNLAPLEGRSVNQRTIAIRHAASSNDIGGCQLVVIHAREQQHWPALQAALKDTPALTVSDSEGFAEHGGMIEFTRTGSRITVAMNIEAVQAAHLQVQERLLHLVTIVRPRK